MKVDQHLCPFPTFLECVDGDEPIGGYIFVKLFRAGDRKDFLAILGLVHHFHF